MNVNEKSRTVLLQGIKFQGKMFQSPRLFPFLGERVCIEIKGNKLEVFSLSGTPICEFCLQ